MGFNKSKSKTDPTKQAVWGGQSPYLQDLYKQASAALPGMTEQWQGNNEAMMQALQGMVGGFDPNNPALQSYANQAAQQFQNQIMPQISQAAQGAGALGGSRQGVAEGVAAGQMHQNIQNFAGQQYQSDMNRALQAALGMGTVGAQSMWAPYMGLAEILGAPTTLTSGGGSQSRSKGISL